MDMKTTGELVFRTRAPVEGQITRSRSSRQDLGVQEKKIPKGML